MEQIGIDLQFLENGPARAGAGMIDYGSLPGASRNPEDREARAYDFGRMTGRRPDAVAIPESAEDVAGIVRWAARENCPIAIRGGGHSQGGQTLADRGLVLDTARLDRVHSPGPELVRVEGGARWGKVVDTLFGTRRLPRVLADHGELTVGGTLSAGGVGTTSHRYGVQIGQVEQLEVVTGTGELVRCSSTRDKDLFDAVRGGQGQFGIITQAWLRLRAAGERFRRHELLYRDFDRFMDDFERIVAEDRFDHLRTETRLHEREIVLHAAVEYDDKPEDERVLEGLGHDEIVRIWDTPKIGRAGMYPGWGFGSLNHHPWRDWFLPWEAFRTLLAQPWLDPRWLPKRPWSWTGSYAIRTEAIDAPLFMRPRGERIVSYSVLAVLGQYQYEQAGELASRLREVDRTLAGLGGKSYLSGGVGYGRGQWEQHYNGMLEQGIRWKREFDPQQVFQGNGMPFGSGPVATGR